MGTMTLPAYLEYRRHTPPLPTMAIVRQIFSNLKIRFCYDDLRRYKKDDYNPRFLKVHRGGISRPQG